MQRPNVMIKIPLFSITYIITIWTARLNVIDLGDVENDNQISEYYAEHKL